MGRRGIKVINHTVVVFRGNSLHESTERGLWADVDTTCVLREDKYVADNTGSGTFQGYAARL